LAIQATAKTIRRLLDDACPREEFRGADFVILQSGELSGNKLPAEGISIYLYLVTANTSRRNLPPKRNASGRLTRPPLPLDLHFLITPWSADPENQLGLLGWAMRVLDDTPIIPAGYLNYDFKGKEVFHPGETVELVFNPISIQDMAALWQNLHQVKVIPSVTYVARLVTLESEIEVGEGDRVQTRVMDPELRS
jgi:hypothetical protein